jgi:hypothetical protein
MSHHDHDKHKHCGPGDSCHGYGHCDDRARFTHVAGANACSTYQNALTCCKRRRRCCG